MVLKHLGTNVLYYETEWDKEEPKKNHKQVLPTLRPRNESMDGWMDGL